jgi:hypothetical protein
MKSDWCSDVAKTRNEPNLSPPPIESVTVVKKVPQHTYGGVGGWGADV